MFRIKILPFILLLGVAAYAQNSHLERITIEDGLSQGMIFDILQDREGFIWAATKDGLNRYDGYGFRLYSHNPFDPYSISGTTITTLFEDSKGRIWVGTENNGINVFDKETERFYSFKNTDSTPHVLNSNYIRRIIEMPDGSILLGTYKGINIIKWRQEFENSFPAEPGLMNAVEVSEFKLKDAAGKISPFKDVVNHFLFSTKNRLWISTQLRLLSVDWKSGIAEVIELPLIDPTETYNSAIGESPDGSIWVGNQEQLSRIRDGRIETMRINVEMENRIANILFDEAGNLYVSFGCAVQFFPADILKDLSTAFNKRDVFFREEGFACAASLERDKTGIIWIGTNGYGLRKFNPDIKSFRHLLKGVSLNRVCEGPPGRLWVRRAYNMMAVDKETGKTIPLDWMREDINYVDIHYGEDNTLWLLRIPWTLEGTSYILKADPDKGPYEKYPLPVSLDNFGKIYKDREGNFWINGTESRLLRFNPATQEMRVVDFSHLMSGNTTAISVMQGKNGDFWFGSPFGLVKMIPQKDTFEFKLYENDPSDRFSLSNNNILSIAEDPFLPEKYLWIGTQGGGLNKMDMATGKMIHFTTANGLNNNVVYGILADDDNFLWLSTNRGLSKFDVRKEVFNVYTVDDGLQDNEFNKSSFLKNENGELMFGGVNGLTLFKPSDLPVNDFIPPVYITGLKINNQPVTFGDSTGILHAPVERTSSIRLKHFQNLVTLDFVSLDYTNSPKNQYRYKLEGIDPDWVEAGTNHTANYAGLPPGHYVFKVMGSNSSGIWNDKPVSLQIDILPPWWGTRLAYIFYFLVILAIVFTIFRVQINRARLQNMLAFRQKESERLAELDKIKTDFFSNITHEFRTPLTLIIEPVRQLLNEVEEEKVREKLKLVYTNSERLHQLVNQLLDLLKLESGQMPLDLRKCNLKEMIRPIYASFLHLAESKGIGMSFKAPKEFPEYYLDIKKVEQVVYNLLSNAVKYTLKGGNISLLIDHSAKAVDSLSHGADNIKITVADTGIGIPNESLSLIFGRFYQVDSSSTRQGEGTGIGLALTKELVGLMGGTINVESRVNEGTTFTVLLPVTGIAANNILSEKASQEPSEWNVNKTPEIIPSSTKHPAVDNRYLLLLIEDNPEMRSFIRLSLPGSFQVMEASNGDEGVAKAIEFIPDLIISDVMMPGKDGFEVTNIIKNDEKTSHIPVLLLTAKAAMESRLKGWKGGADAYLTKPFHTEELIVRIEKLIETRRHLQEKFSNGVARKSLQGTDALNSIDNGFLRNLSLVIEEELGNEELSVDEVAGKMNMSRSQLHRKLTALTNQSASEFVRNYRLDRALELLKNNEGNVTEVSEKVGFSSQKYFSSRFKERFGFSPSEVSAT